MASIPHRWIGQFHALGAKGLSLFSKMTSFEKGSSSQPAACSPVKVSPPKLDKNCDEGPPNAI